MRKILLQVFSLLPLCALAQFKNDSVFVNGKLFLQRDVSNELNIVASHIDKDVQPHHHEQWAYYLNRPNASVATVRQYFIEASNEFGVPVEILEAIGQVENNWTQVGPSIDRGWGIMHLVQNNYCNTLHEAAVLLHKKDFVLKENARQNIRGAAALLKKYFRETHRKRGKTSVRVEDWYPAVKKFSGLISDELRTIQADRYYGVIADGSRSSTLWNEEIILPRNKTIDFNYIKTKFYSPSNSTGSNSGSRSADYGPAVSNFTTCNYTTGRNHSIDTWVNHWIGTGTATGAVSWFQNCSANASAHFVTANNGTIYQVVAVANTAWHCGASGYPYNNSRSIGEEHEATNANPGLWNSTAMLQASAEMACYFCSLYSIPTNQNQTSPGICGHQDMPGTNTDCPGNIPWSTWFTYFNTGNCNASPPVQPANDYCGNEVTLTVYGATCGATTGGDLDNATQSTAPTACDGYTSSNAYDVWFKFVATSSAHDITVVPSSGLDAVVDLRSGCPGTSVDCADDGGGEGSTEILHATGITVGNTYNVRVYDYTGIGNPPTTTTFTICVTTPCTAPVKPVISGTQTICSGQSTTLTVSNPCGGCTYSWSNGGSGTQISVSSSGNYYVTATNSCATTVSDPYGVTVTNNVTPSVSISANTSTTLCSGTSVTFTATPTNGGSPTYQWKLNNNNIATGSTYTNNSLSNGDVVVCVLTSSLTCVTQSTATSNSITMTVNSSVTPAISITANPNGSICSGTNVTFTASISNGGTNPVYIWKKNGNTVGTNSNTYSSSSLANSDVIVCSLSSNANCASPNPVNSNSITMSVTTTVTPAVSISANTGTTVCNGQTVIFTATPTNGGNSPAYQWKLNNNNVAAGSTYTNNSLSNGDVITCELTTSLTNCVTQSTIGSNTLTMSVSGTVVPSISIASTATSICTGESVTISANASGGGSSPSYQWKLNNNNAGTNSTYTNNSLNNGDVITCELTSSAVCANPATATSNSITITVNSSVTPTVNISATPSGNICGGTSVSFNAAITYGGSAPVYQWKSNGSDINGATASTFSSTTLLNGEIITCELVSNQTCANPATALSNSIAMSVTTVVTPSVNISSNLGTTVCSDATVVLTAIPINGGATPTYQWKLNGNNAATGNIYSTSSLGNGDVVTCDMTSSLTCVTNNIVSSNALQMTVSDVPVPVVQLNDCELAATYFPNVNYQWYLSSAIIPSAVSRFYSATQSGYYYVVVTDSISCTAQSADVYVNFPLCLPLGVEETVDENSLVVNRFTVYSLQFTVSKNFVGGEVEVFDAVGNLLSKSEIRNQKSEISTTSLAQGIYFLLVRNTEGKTIVRKISQQ